MTTRKHLSADYYRYSLECTIGSRVATSIDERLLKFTCRKLKSMLVETSDRKYFNVDSNEECTMNRPLNRCVRVETTEEHKMYHVS
jgi:hypothetical protein